MHFTWFEKESSWLFAQKETSIFSHQTCTIRQMKIQMLKAASSNSDKKWSWANESSNTSVVLSSTNRFHFCSSFLYFVSFCVFNSALWTAETVILILWSCGKAVKYLQCISWTKIPNCITYFNRQAVLQQEQLPGVNPGCLSAPPLRIFVGMCWEKYTLIWLILVSCFY